MFDGGYREKDARDIEIPNITWEMEKRGTWMNFQLMRHEGYAIFFLATAEAFESTYSGLMWLTPSLGSRLDFIEIGKRLLLKRNDLSSLNFANLLFA